MSDMPDLFDWRLHVTVFICSITALVMGTCDVELAGSVHIIVLPLVYSVIFAVLCYLSRAVRWIGVEQSYSSSVLMLILTGPLIAKLAVVSGANIDLIIKTGPLLVVEELGDLGAVVIGLPVAILLGFRRECIGMTSSICREPQMAVMIDRYGSDSVEFKGFMVVYIIGAVAGSVIMSVFPAVFSSFIPLHPYSYAMACGLGSTSMNIAGVSSLVMIFPGMADRLYTFSAVSNLISVVFSVYVYLLISLPVTERLYCFIKKRRGLK